MLSFARPPKPTAFDADCERARADIAAIAATRSPKSTDFTDKRSRLWRRHKSAFSVTQHGKCGYCEHDARVGAHCDVEHYAPKSSIERIRTSAAMQSTRVAKLGTQTPAHPVDETHDRGFWWLAFEWDNYLFACEICNRRHKRSLFPVADGADTQPGYPSEGIGYEPLLLNPYEPGLRLKEHLRYDEHGCIQDCASIHGWETIRTCRLDREELREARSSRAKRTSGLLNAILHAARRSDEGQFANRLTDLAELGEASQAFAGMVRIMSEQRLERDWDTLMTLERRLAANYRTRRL